MRLSRRELTIAAGLILAFAVPLTVTLLLTRSEAADSKPQTKPASVRMHRLVLPINTDDPTTMRALISTSLNLPKYYQERNEAFTIEVVAYNAGVHMLRADTSPVQDRIKSLKDAAFPSKIQFSACNVTKDGMEKKEGHPISVLAGVVVVPSGVVRLMELQEKGWSYLRP